MLCVITYISKDAKYLLDSDYRKEVNNVIKTFFCGLLEDEMAVSLYIFWTEYIDVDNNNG